MKEREKGGNQKGRLQGVEKIAGARGLEMRRPRAFQPE